MKYDPQRIRVAAWQFGTSMVLVLGAVMIAASARGQTATIGRTWPIAEPDALAEIEAKAAALPKDLRTKFGPRSHWSAMKAATLGPVRAARVRTVVPSTPYDAKGMMHAALRSPDPVVYLYPAGLRMLSEEVPDEPYEVPLDKAAVRQEGTDLTS